MELNAEQIKKALECCFVICYCNTCPYYKVGEHTQVCTRKMAKDALALINSYEQKIFELENRLKECENGYEGTLALERAKIKDLTEKNKSIAEECCHLLLKVKKLTEENERLHASCTELTQECKKWQERLRIECEYTKADTIRKMQERLQEKAFSVPTVYNSHFGRMIDAVAKEMLEEGCK